LTGKNADKVDVDEDRRNPAYIPKRGLFYEHDDRLESGEEEEEGEEGEEEESSPEKSAEKKSDASKTGSKGSAEKAALKPKRIFKADVAPRWGHDKFMEQEQAPKTSEELVSVYGYDIRNEDNAPRARRRRRYGRGPNKYTRNWEDEAAYQAKPTRGGVSGTPGGGRRKMEAGEEEFPPLGGGGGGGERKPGPPSRRPPREETDLEPQQHRDRQRERERPPREGKEPWHERGEHRGGQREERGGFRGRGRGIGAPFKRGGGDRVRSPGDSRKSGNDEMVDGVEREFSNVSLSGNKDRGGSGRILSQDSDAAGDGKPKRYSSSRPTRGQGPHRGGGSGVKLIKLCFSWSLMRRPHNTSFSS
jgi:protein CASC3